MKKNSTYREQLLELASIYKISDIRNYTKNKKYLTTAQIEHILKKNKVPIPTEINKSIYEIHSKKISRPVSSAGNAIGNFVHSIVNKTINIFIFVIKGIKKIYNLIVNTILNFFSFLNKSTIKILNNAYNFKVEERKANKIVSAVVTLTFLVFFVLGGIQIKNIFDNKNLKQIDTKKNEVLKKQELVKSPKKIIIKKTKELEKQNKKETEKKITKLPEKKASKSPEKVREFILPDLNLKTETVLSLFADVEYDLDKVRINKLVKPIYFTQFPKDLDEISSIQLKKETFIKIILPLVVAENQKIINDREKLKGLSSKKMTSDKEKSWLRQKFKEYKIKNGSMEELIDRMDIIPVSVAIAQAAKESGWGTSRFALEGNAIFGQWTWNGRGIAPLYRSKEESHKILRFPILRASVKAYKNNLNTHKSYREFRDKRSSLRSKRRSIAGMKLIHTLDNYAETGEEYTKILAQIIEQNSLEEFDNVKLTNSVEKKELNL
ncbi:glucosaminidase domain-containing protein [Pelagibacteraceae bacterium]|nr:glucosaminidase domain-containing protein [Pelagibacteraceae bacterium]